MKKKIIIATIAIIIFAFIRTTQQTTIEYTAPPQIQTDTIAQAQQKIKEQIQVLNNKDQTLQNKITALEIQRERIREIKMSFLSALE